ALLGPERATKPPQEQLGSDGNQPANKSAVSSAPRRRAKHPKKPMHMRQPMDRPRFQGNASGPSDGQRHQPFAEYRRPDQVQAAIIPKLIAKVRHMKPTVPAALDPVARAALPLRIARCRRLPE